MREIEITKAIDAQTADKTSDAIKTKGAEKISLFFKASSITSGNGIFTVEVSPDGTNWIAYNKLIDNLINSNVQTLTRVASKTLNSNTSVMVTMDPNDVYQFLRVKLDMTTDGTYDAWVLVQK